MASNNVPNGQHNNNMPAHVSAKEFAELDYDYVICGGGTAGLCIAARLTEDPNVTVGVIEAGMNRLDDPLVDIPAAFPKMLGNPDYDYNYMTVPQLGNKRHHLPRGKMLGGSSGINYMIYNRGSVSDYDDWAELIDDDSWSEKNMKPYMRKHQKLEPISDQVEERTSRPFVEPNHGFDGPIHTSFNDGNAPLDDTIIAAGYHALKKKTLVDPWSGDHIGFYSGLGMIASTGPNRGKRSYAAREYFQPSSQRSNLKLVTEATVARIVLENSNASGVDFIRDSHHYSVKAKREVIVCAGAINSPQILELSGIGDPAVLKMAGVECKIDLPSVGNDLQDHVAAAVIYELIPGESSSDSMTKKPEVLAEAEKIYAESQGGPLSWVTAVQGFLPIAPFLEQAEMDEIITSIRALPHKSDFHRRQREQVIRTIQDPKAAMIQFVLIPATADIEHGAEDQSRLIAPNPDRDSPDGVSFNMNIEYPVARGSVHIKSSDPFEHPEIDPGYLSTEADIAILSASLEFVERMVEYPAMKAKLGKRIFPKPDRDLGDRSARRQTVFDFYAGQYHACGSCAMGSTLDSRLRVKGVSNLRVADCSVFPNHVSGNISSTVYMVAERAADIIKEDWKSRNSK